MMAPPHEAGLWRTAGAERSPFCLKAMRVGAVLATAMMLVLSALSPTQAAGDCRYFNAGMSWMEWLEGSKPRGTRVVLGNEWREIGTPHGQWIAYEPVTDTRVRGWLMVGLPRFMDPRTTEKLKADLDIRESSEIEAALHPQVIELAIGMVRGVIERLDLFPVTEPQPVTIGGLDGRSRIVAATAQGLTTYATVIAVGDGCFFVFGLFSTTDGSRLLPEELTVVSNAIVIEKYEPVTPPAAPPKDWSFESFRRALGLDQANRRQ